jgi:Outer membrane protein beta-barrel domain
VAFNEEGFASTNQNIGGGFVFDLGGGYKINRHVGVMVGLWTAHPDGASASAASIPDPLLFGRPKTVTANATDLKQTDVGVNFQIGWSTVVGDRFRVGIAGGPSIIHVKQDVASIAVTPATQTGVSSIVRESATTGKAGSVALELGYQVTEAYGTSVFIRYAGGEVDLPSHSALKVGGVQMGARLRFWF